jgi:hypothetical protein
MIMALKLTVSLLLVTISLIILTLQIGHNRSPETPFALMFTNPDGSSCTSVCIIGVVLSKTKNDALPRILASHPLSRHLTIRQRLTPVNTIWEALEQIP